MIVSNTLASSALIAKMAMVRMRLCLKIVLPSVTATEWVNAKVSLCLYVPEHS